MASIITMPQHHSTHGLETIPTQKMQLQAITSTN